MRIDQLRRRELIAILGSVAVAWPLAARAQQQAMPVIGFLSSASPGPFAHLLDGFRKGLSQAGYIEGRNVTIEYRWAENQNDRLPVLAAELVRRQVAVIATTGGVSPARAAKAATSTIPIVFTSGDQPIKEGLVASLNRPGGNVTGVIIFSTMLVAKRLELLHELVPNAAIIGVLVNPNTVGAEPEMTDLIAAARTLGQQILVLKAASAGEIDAAFSTLIQHGAGALLVSADALFTNQRGQVVALAARHQVPAIYAWREYIAAGGLISYGNSLVDAYRQAGIYSGRILKGDKPADLPVVQATKFELLVNLKIAKALGLDVPTSILLLADEVIE